MTLRSFNINAAPNSLNSSRPTPRSPSTGTSASYQSPPSSSPSTPPYGLLNATATAIYSWRSWADIHFNIDVFPSILWRQHSSRPSRSSLAPTLRRRTSTPTCIQRIHRVSASPLNCLPPELRTSRFFRSKASSSFVPMKNTTGSLPVFVPRSQPPHARASLADSIGRNSYCKSDYTASIHSPTAEYKIDFTYPATPTSSQSPQSSHFFKPPHDLKPITPTSWNEAYYRTYCNWFNNTVSIRLFILLGPP